MRDNSPAPPDDAPALLNHARLLRKNKWLLLFAMVTGCALGLVVSLSRPSLYRAEVTIELQPPDQSFAASGERSTTEGSLAATISDIQTQIKVLQSRQLIERVVTKLNAEGRKPNPRPRTINLWKSNPPQTEAELTKAAEEGLSVQSAPQTRIVMIGFVAEDPDYAAAFANRLAEEFIQHNIESRWKMSQQTGKWLMLQIDDMRGKLAASERGLQQYAQDKNLLVRSERPNVSEDHLQQIQNALSRAQSERAEKQSRWEIAQHAAPEAIPQVLDDPSLRGLQAKLAELRAQKAELDTTFKSEYSKVKRLDAQIESMQAAADRARAAILSRIKNEYQEALGRERLMESEYAKQSRAVSADAQKSITYDILKREVDSNRNLYETMLQRVKQSALNTAINATNVRIVDAARSSDVRESPRPVLDAGFGGVLSLLSVFVLLVLRERTNSRLQQPSDLYGLSAPQLGTIPRAELGRPPSFDRHKVLTLSSGEGVRSGAVELAAWHKRDIMFADSYHSVLSSILFSPDFEQGSNLIVVTSASAGEGKTTTACNLAISLAEIGKRVLLIDGDLRRPHLHRFFDTQNETGLTTLLTEATITEAALDRSLFGTEVPRLQLLPAGPDAERVPNLLHSAQLLPLLTRLKQRFDTLVIDTPPIKLFPDARILGRLAQGVVLVVRAGVTNREDAKSICDRFAQDRTRVFGIALNDWDPQAFRKEYYHQYLAEDRRSS